MYKEIIICSVVIIAIVTTNWFLQDYTKNSVSFIINELKELKEDIKQEDIDKTTAKMEQIKDEWHKKFKVLAIFIEHNELEKVETDLSALEGFIEVEDYKTGISELNKSIYVLEHIADKYDFSLVNVF
ncbi:MAG: DUF4363 family protein [Clostridia bacterium]|nr:DUF4363 family protein [Clostridia bacterium]